jgi:hypothetical protein
MHLKSLQRTSFSKTIIEFWYKITHIFLFKIEISLYEVSLYIICFSFKNKICLTFPYRPLPFSDSFTNKISKTFCCDISKNKALEINSYLNKSLAIGFDISYTIHQAHAGFNLELNLFLLSISFRIYDGRHWDYGNNRWEEYDEKGYPIALKENKDREITFQKNFEQWHDSLKIYNLDDLTRTPYNNDLMILQWKAIPYIIKQLRKEPSHLTEVLKLITNENPVKEEHILDIEASSRDWIEWWEEYKNKDH